jgi:hypothetical protein
VSDTLRIFLRDLEDSGIDLLEYGRREKELHHLEVINKEFRYRYRLKHLTNGRQHYVFPRWHLVGFSYGLSIQDWQFWGSEPTDAFAGDFWYMVEHPWESMPGAWNE